eukprot:m.1321012 g.1321012  ORF g.1321012 m.1321012 type:complete len:912 (-) comp24846_c0_seq26:1518-4253(-)
MYAVVQLGWNVCEFRNVDLFERGYYKVKAYLDLPKGAVATDISTFNVDERDVTDELGHKKYPGKTLPKAGSIVGFETQICEVKYSDDVFNVYTGMDCQVHIPCDALADIQKTLAAHAPILHVELHFNAKDMYALRKVSKRSYKLNNFGCSHIHVAETVEFDFFYTCAVDLGVSSLLLGFEDKISKAKSRKAVVFRRKRTTSDDAKLNGHDKTNGTWPVAKLVPERRGTSTGLCGVMRTRSGSTSSGGEGAARRSSVYQVRSTPDDSEQQRIDAMPSIDFGTRLQALGRVVCDVLRDLSDHLHRLKHKALADDVTHATAVVHSALTAAGERFALSNGCYDDFTATLEQLQEDTVHVTTQTWEPLKRTMFSPGVRAILLHEAVSRRVRQLEECSFVLHQPRPALADVHSARGQQLLQLASVMRASAYVQYQPPCRFQELTVPFQARHTPLLVEYRYYPDNTDAAAQSWAGNMRMDAGKPAWALGADCEPQSIAPPKEKKEKKLKKNQNSSKASLPKSTDETDDIEYLILDDPDDVAVEPTTPYEQVDDDVTFELPTVTASAGDASLSNPQHIAEWHALVGKLGMHCVPLSHAHPPHPRAAKRATRGTGHLVVCVHGLSGNQYDLRNIRLALRQVFPDMEFLMSSLNTTNTHASFESMTSVFAVEFRAAMEKHHPTRVSFIGHSLGNILIRAALARPEIQELFRLPDHATAGAHGGESMPDNASSDSGRRHTIDSPTQRRRRDKPVLQTYISLAGPHLGAVYLNPLLSAGMWVMSRWKRSASLAALALSDGGAAGPAHSFLYKLSKTNSLTLFQHVVLIASPQDKYVTLSSALLHATPQTTTDPKLGPIYEEMLQNLLTPLEQCSSVKVSRVYMVLPPGPRSVASVIGRAAHIAALDDPVVADKLVANIVRYFV